MTDQRSFNQNPSAKHSPLINISSSRLSDQISSTTSLRNIIIIKGISELREKFEPQNHSILLDTLQNQLQRLSQRMEHEFNEFDSTYQCTLFLVLNLLPLAPKKQQQIQQQPNLCGKPAVVVKKALKVILHVITRLGMTLQRDSCPYFFDLVQLFGDQREGEIRELSINILMNSVTLWHSDLQQLKTLLINQVYENEVTVNPICLLFAKCYQSEDGYHRQFMNDALQLMVTYITQNKNVVENQAIKNLKEILSNTSKMVPKYFYSNLANLMELYENESYHLRNALTDILMHLIEFLVLDKETTYTMEARNKMLDTLLFRQHDKVAFARSAVLNAFSYLLKRNCVPPSTLGPLLDMTLGRIRDVSSWVRKAALQTLRKVVKCYRHLYVVSQDTQQFQTLEEVDAELKKCDAEIEQVHDMVSEVKNEYECKLEDPFSVQNRMSQIKSESDRILQTKTYLQQYRHFLTRITHIMQPVSILMSSRNQGDVLQSVKLAAYMTHYKLIGYELGKKKMMLLIWNRDKITKAEVIKQFYKLYIADRSVPEVSENIIKLYLEADIQEEASLNEILGCFFDEDCLHKLPTKVPQLFITIKLFSRCWQQLRSGEQLPTHILKVVKVYFTQKQSLMTRDHVEFLLEYLANQKAESVNWLTAREVASLFHLTQQKDTMKCIQQCLRILYQAFGSQDLGWLQLCEETLNLAHLVKTPEKLYEFFIKRLSKKLLEHNDNVKQEQIEIENENDPLQTRYAQLIFVVGHVSLKLLTHVDILVQHLKVSKQSKSQQPETELDKISGGVEGEYYKKIDTLQEITERSNHFSSPSILVEILQQNMISGFVPFIMAVVRNLQRGREASSSNTLLEKTCILTLCKLMCVSPDFCRDNLPVLFELLKSPTVDESVKNNIIISLGDLTHRFPNVLQHYHKPLYANLYDENPSVRRITLLVLTHLILNDMVKVTYTILHVGQSKNSLKHIPRLLNDPDQKIPSMVRYFLSELHKKDPRGILNAIPDLMTNLSNKHEEIVPQIIAYLDKGQVDPLVDKLLISMAESSDPNHLRSIAFCVAQLQLSMGSFKKILDRWEELRSRFADPYVLDQFRNAVKKQRRGSNINAELKALLDELEEKLDNHKSETFDGRRRLPEKTKKRMSKAISEPMEVEEILNKKVSRVRPRISKRKKRLLESDDESDEN